MNPDEMNPTEGGEGTTPEATPAEGTGEGENGGEVA
jgi:hypothetical protein